MDQKLKDKIILITGAGRGMGKALAEKTAEMGAKVILVTRDKSKGEKVLQEFKAKNWDVTLEIADMSKTDSIIKLCKRLIKTYNHIDILVNNAAILLDNDKTRIENLDIWVLYETFQTNFYGPFLLIQELLPLLKKAPEARILNYSSSMAKLSGPKPGTLPAYSMSKTAINALTRNLAHELTDTNIKSFCLDPGWVRTDMGGVNATYSIEEGIDTALYLSTEESSKLENGRFYFLRKVIDW